MMIFNSNKKDINSHDVLADLFEGKNVKQAMKAAKSVSFDSEIEKFLAEALICLREITGEKNPAFCDRKINSKNGDILLNRAFDWFETARKSAKTGSDEEMSLVREIMFSEYVLNCFIMGASENKGCCLYSIVHGINSRQQGDQQSFNDSFFEKAFAGAGDAGVSEEILRAYREELRDATAVSNSQGAAEVKTVTVNQGGGKDSSEAEMIFEEGYFLNGKSSSTAQNITIAAADRNNKEKDASDKSAPQAEFKRLEIDGGDVFEGYFLNGKKNGHGKYTWANGDIFDGNWVDGKRTGKGRITWSNGASFDGEWKDNQMSEGKYTFPDGEIYDGSFQNGKKEGYGKQVFPNGEKYEGQWHDGKKHGHGTYTWADGDTYEGDWKDGKRCGRGKVIQYGKSPSGETYVKRSYDGEWLDGKEHGHGICVEGDFGWEKMDKVFEGEWVNGKRQGRFVWYFTNSKGGRYIDFYEDGKWIEGGIPYDERIKTVEDIRRAKGKTSGASENLNHMNMSKIPSWDSVKSGDYSDKVKKETEARRQYIRETVRRLRNPEENASPYYRNIENACMMLAPFMTEAENLFLKGEEEKALEIIEEMLDINIVPDDEWYYNSDTKYFSQFLSGALYSLASQIDFDTPDHDRFIVPAANIACYIWKKFGDHSLFYAVAHLWIEAGKDIGGNYLWIERMRDNGDCTVMSDNDIDEQNHCFELERSLMGSDCELF